MNSALHQVHSKLLYCASQLHFTLANTYSHLVHVTHHPSAYWLLTGKGWGGLVFPFYEHFLAVNEPEQECHGSYIVDQEIGALHFAI